MGGFRVRLQGTKKQRGRVSRPVGEVGESYSGTGMLKLCSRIQAEREGRGRNTRSALTLADSKSLLRMPEAE